MAIDTGLAITCGDLQSTGGISQILLRSFDSSDTATPGGTGVHTYSSIANGGGVATWFVYEFKNEIPTLAIAANKREWLNSI